VTGMYVSMRVAIMLIMVYPQSGALFRQGVNEMLLQRGEDMSSCSSFGNEACCLFPL